MNIESLPTFTRPARQRWESIPADIRQRLLTNVWCGQCRHEVTITNFSGTIKGGNLLLVGKCAECRGDVARVHAQYIWSNCLVMRKMPTCFGMSFTG